MKKVGMVLFVLVAAFAAGCGDSEIEGPVPVEGSVSVDGPIVMYQGDLCITNDDCGAQKVCQMDLSASDSVGYTVMVCVIGCDAELKTEKIENKDGTSETKTVKVSGTDTCQRFGDSTLYCDLVSHTCKEYETEVPAEPEEPAPEPEEPGVIEAPLTSVSCCYDGELDGYFGQLAWSMAVVADPEAWEAARDLQFDAEGCFSADVDLTLVTLGFWVDLTVGPHDGKASSEMTWAGASMKPRQCSVGEEATPPGEFEKDYGWPFYTAAGEM